MLSDPSVSKGTIQTLHGDFVTVCVCVCMCVHTYMFLGHWSWCFNHIPSPVSHVPGSVEAEMLHMYSQHDLLILCVRLAVLLAVTLTVPVVLFPVCWGQEWAYRVEGHGWMGRGLGRNVWMEGGGRSGWMDG